MWTRDEGIAEINRLKDLLGDCDYFPCLCAGVLHRGFSEHDLDIVLGSITGEDNLAELIDALNNRAGLTFVKTWQFTPTMVVYAYDNEQGKRIDFFIFTGEGRYTLLDSIAKWSRRGWRSIRAWRNK